MTKHILSIIFYIITIHYIFSKDDEIKNIMDFFESYEMTQDEAVLKIPPESRGYFQLAKNSDYEKTIPAGSDILVHKHDTVEIFERHSGITIVPIIHADHTIWFFIERFDERSFGKGYNISYCGFRADGKKHPERLSDMDVDLVYKSLRKTNKYLTPDNIRRQQINEGTKTSKRSSFQNDDKNAATRKTRIIWLCSTISILIISVLFTIKAKAGKGNRTTRM